MKGIVFTELLDLVDQKFGERVLDEVIEASPLSTGGAYTSVGTYDHAELLALVVNLSRATGVPVAELVRVFGHHLLRRFAVLFPDFFDSNATAFDFLSQVEDVIHVEVRKLFPDAELPRFEIERTSSHELRMTYRSSRPLADLAHGLIEETLKHYGEEGSVERGEKTNGGITFKVTSCVSAQTCPT